MPKHTFLQMQVLMYITIAVCSIQQKILFPSYFVYMISKKCEVNNNSNVNSKIKCIICVWSCLHEKLQKLRCDLVLYLKVSETQTKTFLDGAHVFRSCSQLIPLDLTSQST